MCGDLNMEMESLIEKVLKNVYKDESLVFDKSRFAGGLTNYNYIMEIHGMEYVIRKPGIMTDLMIDRKIEKINNQIASEMGINSECIYFNEESGIKISKYIKNSKNIGEMDPCNFENIAGVSNLMKKTHSSKELFPNVFDWQEELSKYEKIVVDDNGVFFFDHHKYKEKLIKFMEENINNVNLLPCHNDTVPENFLLSQEGQLYLIDWEYAGMNDPSWDIAAYILESRLTKESIDYILLDYYGEIPSDEEMLKMKCYMAAQDLLWSVWAMIRHYNGDDFLEYCNQRYQRFKKKYSRINKIIRLSSF